MVDGEAAASTKDLQVTPTDVQQLIIETEKKKPRPFMKIFVVFLGLLIFAGVLTSALFTTVFKNNRDQLGALSFDPKKGKLLVENAGVEDALTGLLGQNVVSGTVYKRKVTDKLLSYEWLSGARLKIEPDQKLTKCFVVNWMPGTSDIKGFQDDFYLNRAHWFGGSELYIQAWPLEKANLRMQPYIPSDTILDYFRNGTAYGGVLERYWVNSRGIAIVVDDSVPLHVSFNDNDDNTFSLRADWSEYALQPIRAVQLTYRLCLGNNIKSIHQYVMSHLYTLPTAIPNESIFKYPIWSTWAQYGKGVTQDNVLEYAATIQRYNFSCSQIEIDDMYSTKYGDFDFNPKKFPDPTSMVRKIHDSGFAVTLWMYPFANTDSQAFNEGLQYWVNGPGKTPGLIRWWNGLAAVLDTTNENATAWFVNRLKSFQSKYQIDGFKFDAGEVSYLPKYYALKNLTYGNPSFFSAAYSKLASHLGDRIEVRVGYRTQSIPTLVRFLDRASRWDEKDGLRSVIPATLTLGLLGYPFVLPDMIGGNGFWSNPDELETVTFKPDNELYVRWMQASVFLPTMQFSFPPWLYDNATVTIAKRLLDLREKISGTLIRYAKKVNQSTAPIIRPLWWIAPNDETALQLNSEFLVGNDYLVAPVLRPFSENKGKHKVYLPEGKWRKEFGTPEDIIVSKTGKWIEYVVTLEDLPYFSSFVDRELNA